ncbi:SDR family NAD(P)-dependent oxidoreductase [soil metagenome]
MGDEFEGRVIVVTGAGSGIGAQIAGDLLARGATVVGVDRSAEGLRTVRERLGDPAGLSTTECDIADEEEVIALFGHIGLRLDGLVNAAGIVVTSQFLQFSVEDWQRTFSVNVLGTYLLMKHAQPLLAASGAGRIVNFSSMAGKIPNQFTAPYAASKAAVISVTRSAAVALAPAITVNCVCPGIIDTPMWGQLGRELAGIGAPIDFKQRSEQAPLGRAGTAEDVAGVVVFLLSDAAAFITGEDVNVSGGLAMH